MRLPTLGRWAVVLAAVLIVAGCSDTRAVRRQADAVCERVVADTPAAPRMPAEPVAQPAPSKPVGKQELTLYLAPREEPLIEVAAAQTPEKPAAQPAATETKPAKPQRAFAPIDTQSFDEIVKNDLRGTPAALWRGTKYSFANTENLLVLSLAFGADRIVRNNVDRDVREELRSENTSLHETGDFGSVIGNPALHFGLAGAWYLFAVDGRDAKQHDFSKTMLEALTVNVAATGLLKASVHDHSPNGERFSWPSGHMSSSMCFASVIHEYYGWQAALPLYLLAGYSGASRLEDREHNVSDLVFGGALGWVIGHSIVKGELPQIAGFYVLPYGSGDAGGLMLMKSW